MIFLKKVVRYFCKNKEQSKNYNNDEENNLEVNKNDERIAEKSIITKEQQMLLYFLEGNGEDVYGRTLQFILEKESREWFELTHNYIQWLFPLREPSNFAYSVSLTDTMVEYIKNNETILENIKKSFKKMLNFYGFDLEEDNIVIISTHQEMVDNWLNPCNHNFLRITRILGCLSIVGYNDLAKKWLIQLEYVSKGLGYVDKAKAKEYWRDAVSWK